jgi:hypothetical protein
VPSVVQLAAATAQQRAHDPLAGASDRVPRCEAPAAQGPAPAVQLCGAGGCAGGCAKAGPSRGRGPVAGVPRAGGVPPSAVLSRLGSGTPMPPGATATFTDWWGSALPPLALHTDSAVASDLGARALTVGRHVAFAPGEFRPGSGGGDALISHELAHVVQQSGGSTGVQGCCSGAEDAYEAEADVAARAAATGGTARLSQVRGSAAGSVQRSPDPRLLTTELTPQAAALLSRDALVEQFRLGHTYLETHPATAAHVGVVRTNLLVLQTEMYRRSAGTTTSTTTGAGGVGVLPRPAGLPEDAGYVLVEATDLPPELVAEIPEGQLLDSLPTPGGPAGPAPSGGVVLPGLEIGGGTSGGVLTTTARSLGTLGFAPGGPNAIGLVSFPQVGSPGHGFPQSRLLWGHTAMYTRIDGRITILRSHAPASIIGAGTTDWLRGGAVKSGSLGVPGAYYGQGYTPGRGIPMFTHTGAHSIEYPVSRAAALAAAEGLPEIGPSPLRYTGVPSAANLCQGMNCVRWAVPAAEGALGGRFGPVSPAGLPTSVTDIGPGGAPGLSPNQASQGRMYGWMRQAQGEPILGWDNRTGARVVATVGRDGRVAVSALPAEATGAPTVGRMSTGMKYLRWGGRVFFVVGIGAGSPRSGRRRRGRGRAWRPRWRAASAGACSEAPPAARRPARRPGWSADPGRPCARPSWPWAARSSAGSPAASADGRW